VLVRLGLDAGQVARAAHVGVVVERVAVHVGVGAQEALTLGILARLAAGGGADAVVAVRALGRAGLEAAADGLVEGAGGAGDEVDVGEAGGAGLAGTEGGEGGKTYSWAMATAHQKAATMPMLAVHDGREYRKRWLAMRLVRKWRPAS
jgi:hypothetical protein